MKRLLISIAILCALFLFIFASARMIDDFCDDSVEKLDMIATLYENGAGDEAKHRYSELNSRWEKEKPFLFFFVKYDYIYEVDESLEQLGLCVNADVEQEQALDEFMTQKEEVSAKLHYLDDSTSIHWSTIF